MWNGFSRQENLQDWLKNGWVRGSLEVESFTEKGKEFPLPPGKRISVLVSQKDKDYFSIITRPAKGNKDAEGSFTKGHSSGLSEVEVHGRWPELEDK